ncbi:MAG: hypothetical protein ACT452_07185 [Microthrixaceae bacterium]
MTTLPLDSAQHADLAPLDVPVDAAEEVGLVASMQQRLAESLVALRRRAGAPTSLDGRLAIVGGMLAAAGAVLVLLGWYGASHTSRVYLQIPYLISGGLLGVVLAFVGGCAYLASWLTRLVQDERERTDEALAASRDTAAALQRIEALLASTIAGPSGTTLIGADSYVSTPSGKLAHRPTCPAVAGRTDLRPVTVGPDGPPLCRMCDES